ncbi:MAG: PadR family transcriptional regulator [Phototrophicaceae bacterium]|jgi:DNA-binding PadR family transcriptional regulator
MNIKGSLRTLVLYTLSLGDKHGYEIGKTIRTKSDGVLDFKEGTLYPTLHNLEEDGLILGYDNPVGGRQRRYYQITDAGRDQLKANLHEWGTFVQAINAVLDSS